MDNLAFDTVENSTPSKDSVFFTSSVGFTPLPFWIVAVIVYSICPILFVQQDGLSIFAACFYSTLITALLLGCLRGLLPRYQIYWRNIDRTDPEVEKAFQLLLRAELTINEFHQLYAEYRKLRRTYRKQKYEFETSEHTTDAPEVPSTPVVTLQKPEFTLTD